MAIGNTKVDELIQRVKRLSDSLAWFEAFDNATREQIISWIQNDQLRDEGWNKFGKVIGIYSYETQRITDGKKIAGDPYDLFDTGEFFKSFVIRVFAQEIIIDANAQKGKDNLFDKFGNEIIGLTDENFRKLKEKVKISYIKYARKVLQLD